MPRESTSKAQPTTVIGWQGYTLTVPEDWTIAAIGGDEAEGYLRLDGPDMPRCELKWFAGKGPTDIGEVVGNYLKDLTKKRRRGDPDVIVHRDTRLLGRRRGGRSQLECFAWESDQQGQGAAWRCPTCSRITIAQLLGSLDEPLEELAQEILLSIGDHARDGWVTWAAYGLQCEVPVEFKLDGQKMMAGLIELNFMLETEHLAVLRWGMADVVLANTKLRDWTRKEIGKRLKNWDCSYEEVEVDGHPGVAVSGDPVTVQARVRRFAAHCTRKVYGSNARALVWHCAPEKKIYCVECIVDDSRLDLPNELCRRIPCHR
jgi:hypothetical protein